MRYKALYVNVAKTLYTQPYNLYGTHTYIHTHTHARTHL